LTHEHAYRRISRNHAFLVHLPAVLESLDVQASLVRFQVEISDAVEKLGAHVSRQGTALEGENRLSGQGLCQGPDRLHGGVSFMENPGYRATEFATCVGRHGDSDRASREELRFAQSCEHTIR